MIKIIDKLLCLLGKHKYGNAEEESFYVLKWTCKICGKTTYYSTLTSMIG
jgi:hypothetical protein